MLMKFPLKKPREDLTFEDLHCCYSTFRPYVKSGSGRDKVYDSFVGVVTPVGEIEISEWRGLVKELIARAGEEELFEHLKVWAKEECAWLHTKQEIEDYALELHANRIFDNPDWADYQSFRK